MTASAPLSVVAQGVPLDSLRRALDQVFARREYQWVKVWNPWEWLRELWYRLLDWLATVRTVHPAGYRLLFVVLVVLLAGVLVHFTWVVWRMTHPTVSLPARSAAPGGMRLEDVRAYQERADALAREGRFAQALAYRFVALMLQLEGRHAVTFHPSKTPAEYLHEARLDPVGSTSLADLVATLYRHVFGAVPCDERGYRDFAAIAELVYQHVAPA